MFTILHDLWEGCVDFEDAVQMAGIKSDDDRRTAETCWSVWDKEFEASLND